MWLTSRGRRKKPERKIVRGRKPNLRRDLLSQGTRPATVEDGLKSQFNGRWKPETGLLATKEGKPRLVRRNSSSADAAE